MSDSWLDNGHGDGLSLAPVRSVPTPESGLTQGPRSGAWRSRSGRTFVAVVAIAAVIGSTGTAYAIRETLFPNIGAPTARSVWQNPVPVDERASVAVTTSTSSTTTSTSSTTSTTTSTTMPTTTSGDSNVRTLGVPTTTSDDTNVRTLEVPTTTSDDSDDPPSVPDGGSGSSGAGSDDPDTDFADMDDSGSEEDSSGPGSGADDSVDTDGSGSDDGVDELED